VWGWTLADPLLGRPQRGDSAGAAPSRTVAVLTQGGTGFRDASPRRLGARAGSTAHREKAPGAGYSIECMFALVGELDAGADDEIHDRAGHEHLTGGR
jgi:hypothetical protein